MRCRRSAEEEEHDDAREADVQGDGRHDGDGDDAGEGSAVHWDRGRWRYVVFARDAVVGPSLT